MGIPTRKIMVVPCMVKSRLNVSGGTTWSPDHASWIRIAVASAPAIMKKARPVTTYMIPRRLWSTVMTQSWSCSSRARRCPAASGFVVAGDSRGLSGEAVELLASHPIGRITVQPVRRR